MSPQARRWTVLLISVLYSSATIALATVLFVHRHHWLAAVAVLVATGVALAFQMHLSGLVRAPGQATVAMLAAGPASSWLAWRLLRRSRPLLWVRPRP